MTSEQFRQLGHELVDWIAGYIDTIDQRRVLAPVTPGEISAMLPAAPPDHGEDWRAIIGDLERVVMPGITHWQSPGFFAFFPANGSFPAILGDLVSTGLGVNGMLWATSPAATEIETRILDWLGGMIGLPAPMLSGSGGGSGGGVIQGTASEATLVAMVAARARALRHSTSVDRPHLALYTSTQAHSSVVKAAMIAGLADGPDDRRHIRLIDVGPDFAMDAAALDRQIRADEAAGLVPFFICATVGTTSSTAVDPLESIGPMCVRPGGGRIWLHVDAAMAGAACICPEYRGLIRGVEHADSFCFNPHKWLLTNFDCSAMWTRDVAAITGALSITPEYLRNAASGSVIDYRDWQVPLGRRFRALKLWFVIRHYGVQGLQAYIREHMRLAEQFEQWVRADERFEVLAPRTITLICFRLRPRAGESAAATDARNRTFLAAINQAGSVYLSHTVLPVGGHGVFTLRMAIGGSATRESHIRAAWELIARLADAVP